MEHAVIADKILVGVDGSDANRPAVEWAAREARARRCGLVAVNAWHIPAMAYSAPGYMPISTDWASSAAAKTVDEAIAGATGTDGIGVQQLVVEGSAYDSLAREADEPGIGLVVVGTRGHGAVASMFLGSVAHSMSHHCPKPLVIVPHIAPSGDSPIRHLVVGVDGSEGADQALRWAATEAGIHGARLEIVVAWNWTSPALHVETENWRDAQKAAHETITGAVDRLDAQGIDLRLTEQEGVASDVLLEAARSADLLVVGTRRLSRAKEILLGSTSHYCTHHSPVPIAVIPATWMR